MVTFLLMSAYSLMGTNVNIEENASIKIKKLPCAVMNRRKWMDWLADLLPIASNNGRIVRLFWRYIAPQSRPDAVKILLTDDAPQFRKNHRMIALLGARRKALRKLSPVKLKRLQ
jgi:hypothetical protein